MGIEARIDLVEGCLRQARPVLISPTVKCRDSREQRASGGAGVRVEIRMRTAPELLDAVMGPALSGQLMWSSSER